MDSVVLGLGPVAGNRSEISGTVRCQSFPDQLRKRQFESECAPWS